MHDLPRLYAIADYSTCVQKGLDIFDFAKAYFTAGGKILQYRDKLNGYGKIIENCTAIKSLCDDVRGLFIINDNFEAANELNVPLHLGQQDFKIVKSKPGFYHKKLYWGLSTHNEDEIQIALQEKADYIGFGTIFPSKIKPGIKRKLCCFGKCP